MMIVLVKQVQKLFLSSILNILSDNRKGGGWGRSVKHRIGKKRSPVLLSVAFLENFKLIFYIQVVFVVYRVEKIIE